MRSPQSMRSVAASRGAVPLAVSSLGADLHAVWPGKVGLDPVLSSGFPPSPSGRAKSPPAADPLLQQTCISRRPRLPRPVARRRPAPRRRRERHLARRLRPGPRPLTCPPRRPKTGGGRSAPSSAGPVAGPERPPEAVVVDVRPRRRGGRPISPGSVSGRSGDRSGGGGGRAERGRTGGRFLRRTRALSPAPSVPAADIGRCRSPTARRPADLAGKRLGDVRRQWRRRRWQG